MNNDIADRVVGAGAAVSALIALIAIILDQMK